jgi:hypothetical protein
VNENWQLVELHGCWWAYEGKLPPPEAFTRRSSGRIPLARSQRRCCGAARLLATRRAVPAPNLGASDACDRGDAEGGNARGGDGGVR